MPLEFGCSYIAAIRETMSCANDIIDDPESKIPLNSSFHHTENSTLEISFSVSALERL
ncbi:predicted protein [Botrytis cinerea T4]|uniref:Uncharacterized protein n=1 Tax=Botryotinia fuckeliana (strain T4) TaxID=999810 RepID=G2XPD9_BOTF4|nr:predicted protein [Botrytis cinerea T4]